MTHRIPVIITTNKMPMEIDRVKPKNGYLLDAIGTGAYSRLMHMAGNRYKDLEGPDLR